MSEYFKRESRTLIEIADDLNDLVTELNDKIAELIREKNVDAVPVRHGRWDFDMSGAWCSVCGEYSEGEWNYCPNCGAKMDGENDE